jgi:hypothetical protein
MFPNHQLRIGHRETFGRYYLKKAVDFVYDREFGKSYEFFKEGLDYRTCDCNFDGWRSRFKKSHVAIFEDLRIEHKKHYEYYFVKAYMLSFESGPVELHSALDAINRYTKVVKDEYGPYVTGKILLALGKHDKACDAFYSSYSTTRTPRTAYRVGRTKEQNLNEYGLYELFESFIMNPSSPCCARNLQKYMKQARITIDPYGHESNVLVKSFMQASDERIFSDLYHEHITTQRIGEELNPQYIEALPIVENFIEVIRMNFNLVGIEVEGEE